MTALSSNRWQIVIRLIAALTAISAIILAYEGFQGAWDEHEALWAVPVVLAVFALGLMLWEEEISAARADRMRAARDREKLAEVQTQQPHGSPPPDGTI
ncbi:MAG TPA: hypothetical protein VGG48_00920 [Rhizomicrobium sp.]|jgi:cyanate permease